MNKKYIPIIGLIVGLVALDQLTKQIVLVQMTLGQSILLIKNFFYLTSHRNTGGAWGIFSDQMVFFYIITIIAFGLFVYLLKDADFKKNPLYTTGITLMVAGGIGNFIDRVIYQEVVDFLDFYIFGYDFPIFNVADICLTVGTAIFAIVIILEDVFHKKNLPDNS